MCIFKQTACYTHTTLLYTVVAPMNFARYFNRYIKCVRVKPSLKFQGIP